MTRRLLIPLAAVCVFAVSCSTLAVAAATVNGDKITEADVERQLDVIRGDPVFGEALRTDPDERGRGRREILTRLIYSMVAEQEAARLGIRPTAGQIDRLLQQRASSEGLGVSEFLEAQNLSNAEGRRIAEQLVREFALQERVLREVDIDTEELREQYEANEQAFVEADLERITVRTDAEVRDALEKVNSGQDFGDLAEEVSIDDAASDDGALGYVALSTLPPEVQSAVSAAVVGGVTDPIQTQIGFEIYHVVDRRTKSFEDAEDEIRASLTQTQRQESYSTWLAGRVKKAKIVVNPKYGVFDRNQAQVVPGPSELEP
jgi:parvulin-like peptidyl-prolyl isomerase